MVQGIRVAQESYQSETMQYANISQSLTAYYPDASPNGKTMTAWGGACSSQCVSNMSWSMLPLHVDGPVMFGYATTAGQANTGSPEVITVDGQALTLPNPSPTDWFIVSATCDLDSNGSAAGSAGNTNVYAMSWTNQAFVSGGGN
jgi:hypothetical protein